MPRIMEADHPEDEALLAVSQAADLEAALTLLNRDCELCATVMNIKEVREQCQTHCIWIRIMTFAPRFGSRAKSNDVLGCEYGEL